MIISPQLTTDEFKDLHNAKSELNFAIDRLNGIVSPQVMSSLKKAMSLMTKGLARSYDEEIRVFEARRLMYRKIAADNRLVSHWSMYEINDMSAVPYPGATLLRYDGGFGSPSEVAIDSQATWTRLWQYADLAVKRSGDEHHIFIEALTLVDGVVVLSTSS